MSVNELTFNPGDEYSSISLNAREYLLDINYGTVIPWEKLDDFILAIRTLRQLSGHNPESEPF